MSAWIKCPKCGKPKEVPAYEGDGVYSEHTCEVVNHSDDFYKKRAADNCLENGD